MGIYAMYSVTFKLDGRENWGIQGEGGARSDQKILSKDLQRKRQLERAEYKWK